MKAFSTRTYGKWILAGEHAVLRGHPALAFPLMSRFLDLSFTPSDAELEVEFSGERGEELKLLFYGVIENALSRLGHKLPLRGRFHLHSELPVGAGLGASAALCGAVARWCEAQGWVEDQDVYDFARRLEDLFHGESSGVDLAVALSGRGIHFVRGGDRQAVDPVWWPERLYLSYCGQRGMTAECVAQVKRLHAHDSVLATQLDQQMHKAVQLAAEGLRARSSLGLGMLKHALDLGRDCFTRWQLTTGNLDRHINELEAAGAWAVKPTGSGGGGYVLSLWRSLPPAHLEGSLVPVRKPL